MDDGLRETDPAARRRGRVKGAGRSRNRGPEKVITNALGILLIAERAALLTGRDDEFVAVVTKGYTGVRWGELMGLETQFIRPGIPARGNEPRLPGRGARRAAELSPGNASQ